MRIFKIDHIAKAIAHAEVLAFAKWSVLGQKLKMQKACEKRFYVNATVVLCKKRLRKTPNIREMRQF